MGKLSAPGIAEQVAEDEGRFLDRSRIKAYVVQEYETPVSEERALVPWVGLGGATEIRPEGRYLETVANRDFRRELVTIANGARHSLTG